MAGTRAAHGGALEVVAGVVLLAVLATVPLPADAQGSAPFPCPASFNAGARGTFVLNSSRYNAAGSATDDATLTCRYHAPGSASSPLTVSFQAIWYPSQPPNEGYCSWTPEARAAGGRQEGAISPTAYARTTWQVLNASSTDAIASAAETRAHAEGMTKSAEPSAVRCLPKPDACAPQWPPVGATVARLAQVRGSSQANGTGYGTWGCIYQTNLTRDGTIVASFHAHWWERGGGEANCGRAPASTSIFDRERQADVSWTVNQTFAGGANASAFAAPLLQAVRERAMACPGGATPPPAPPTPPPPEAPPEVVAPCPIIYAVQTTGAAGSPCPETTVTFRGRVTTVDRTNQHLPLPRARVVVLFGDGRDNVTTWTGDDGAYRVTAQVGPARINFSLQVELWDRDGVVVVRDQAAYGLDVVRIRTEVTRVTRSVVVTNLLLAPPYPRLAPDIRVAGGALAPLPAGATDVLHDAAVVYARTMEAARFGRDVLGVRYDHALPVDVVLNHDAPVTVYQTASSTIRIGRTNSSAEDWNSPDNREYHEFAHHIQTDAPMGGENTYVGWLGTDCNHCGVRNSNSSDSLSEGFAEFLSGAIRDDPLYRYAGRTKNLEHNYHRFRGGAPDEEFNLASTLWDLLDTPPDRSDYFDLDLAQLWAVLNRPEVVDARSLYLALNATYGRQDSNATDRRTDLAALFHDRGLCADIDGNLACESTEPAGYADFWPQRARPPGGPFRHSRQPEPGSDLDATVLDPAGQPLVAREFTVTVSFADPALGFTYRASRAGDTGPLGVDVPFDAARVEVAPVVPGFAPEAPLVLDPGNYSGLVDRAQAAGNATFLSHTFRMRASALAPPGAFAVQPLPDGALRFTWTLPPGATGAQLVRGAARPPATPADGAVVFEGPGTEFTDAAVMSEVPYHYALFSVGADGAVSTGATASATPVEPTAAAPAEGPAPPAAPPPPPPPAAANTPGLEPVLALGVLALAAASRRRGR